MLEIRRINKFTYDLFFGKGWDNWTRVHQGRSSTHRTHGEKLRKSVLKELDEVLAPNMPVTYGQTVEEMLHNVYSIN